MEVILLERIARLGGVGDVVRVKNGFGRNYLIPQQKALLANKKNVERFESQREALEELNATRREAARIESQKLEGVLVTVIRQAGDDGKLYGSVTVRDVADALKEQGLVIDRRLIDLNTPMKALGVYEVTVSLHPEVPVAIKVHVAPNADSPLPEELRETKEAKAESVAVDADADADAVSAADDAAESDADTDTDAA